MQRNTREEKTISDAIGELYDIVAKGQEFAKWNKDRKIRATIREIEALYSAPTFNHVKTIFVFWALNTCKAIWESIKNRFNLTVLRRN